MLSPLQILQTPKGDARRFARRVLPLCIVTILSSGVRPAHADGLPTLDSAATRISDLVAEKLKELSVNELVVTTFVNPHDAQKPGGPGIAETIKDKLRQKGIRSVRKSDYSLTGQFRVSANAQKHFPDGHIQNVPAAKIFFQLKQKGKQQLLLDSSLIDEDGLGIVEDHADLGTIAGLITPINNAKDLARSMGSDRSSEPLVEVADKWIQLANDPNLKVQILKARASEKNATPRDQDYKPVDVLFEGNLPYISLKHDDIYIVQIRNDHPYAVAARLTIDGLNMFHFSEEKEKRTDLWIFPSRSTYVLRGWHRKGNEVYLFKISDYAGNPRTDDESENATDVGAISVSFFSAWKPGENPPPNENITGFASYSQP